MTTHAYARFADALWRDVNDAADVAAFRRATVRRLAGLVGVDSAVFTPAPPPLGNGEPADSLGIDYDTAPLKRFGGSLSRYAVDLRPFLRAMAANGGMAISNDVYSKRELDTLRICREIHIPAGVTSVLSVALSFRSQAAWTLSLNRHGRVAPYRIDDLAPLRAVMPLVGLADTAIAAQCAPSVETDAHSVLTPRERQVAFLLRSGLQNKEIAAALGSSAHTVKKQTIRVYEKLRVGGRVELIARLGPTTPGDPQ
jgi:DNA-binding CsgD family transcriptional regulator